MLTKNMKFSGSMKVVPLFICHTDLATWGKQTYHLSFTKPSTDLSIRL